MGWAAMTRSRIWVGMIGLGVTACAPCASLDDVEVEGGSAGARARVQQALADFAGWTGRDTVCVNRVEIVEAIEPGGDLESLGRYRSSRRLIQLAHPQDHLYDTLIHELCHAIDHRERITRRHRGEFPYDPAAHDYEARSERSRQREGMALTCEAGPEALAIAATVAPRCAPNVDIGFVELVLDEVYGPMPSSIGAAPSLHQVPVASWTLPDGWSLFGPQPVASSEDGDLLVAMEHEDGRTIVAVDPYDGEFLGSPSGSQTSVLRSPPPPSGSYLWDDVQTARWEDDHRLTTFRWRLASGDEIRPLLVHDGDQWLAPATPCASPESWIVEIDREPWIVRHDEGTLSWSRVERD